MVDEDAGTCPFEVGLFSCPDARKLFLGLCGFSNGPDLLLVECPLQKVVAETPLSLDVDAYLALAYSHGYGFAAMADIEIYSIMSNKIRLSMLIKLKIENCMEPKTFDLRVT